MVFPTHQLRFLWRFISMSASQEQMRYMTMDKCFVVDKSDKILTTASKKECHRVSGLLHRAFSLFIFRESSYSGTLELLMQKRSDKKLTFPLLWTNSSCSHPCANYVGESEEANALGVRRAARRKAHHELGIDVSKCLFVDDIHFLTKIHYSALNEPADGIWCENEIDYLLVAVLPQIYSSLTPSVHVRPNPEEVSDIAWSTLPSLEAGVHETPHLYTPWFRKITSSGLLQQMWQWTEEKTHSSSSDSFKSMDQSWDRSRILEL